MFLPDLVVRSRRILVGDSVRPAALHVRHGKIIGVLDFDNVPSDCPLDDASDLIVMPGMVDVHTRLGTASSAATGGVTTIINGNSLPSGPLSQADLHAALRANAKLGVPVMIHAASVAPVIDVSELCDLCRKYRTRMHFLSVTSDALVPIFRARTQRLPVSAGACPSSLLMAESLSERKERELLWASLSGGLLQTVSSDQPPANLSSIELSLSATWTAAALRKCSIGQVATWLCRAPAQLAGLDRKGAIDVGYDADLAIWDPDEEFTAAGGTAYSGRRLRGVVKRTYLEGTKIYERGTPMRGDCV